MKKSKEKRYVITVKGIIYDVVRDEELADKIYNALELQGQRLRKGAGKPAILLTPDGGSFVTLEERK